MTLFQIVVKKEQIHWRRMRNFMKEFKGLSKIGGLFFVKWLINIHYAYTFMHVGFECVMFVINRSHFRANIYKLEMTLKAPEIEPEIKEPKLVTNIEDLRGNRVFAN